jgi:hypothetical protein
MKKERHLTGSEVIAAAWNDPVGGASARLREQRACTSCRADIVDFRELRRVLAQRSEEPSEGVVLRATALMVPSPARADLGRFRLARLLHDSGRLEHRTQVRAPAASRHQLWRAANADIDLRLEGPSLGTEALLIGQVLPHRRHARIGEGSAWLREGRGRPRWAPISTSGEFSLPRPSGRRWTILLEWGAVRARIRMS